jgi:hypothetical protein
MQPETTLAVEAFGRLERKKHQMEKTQHDLDEARAALADAPKEEQDLYMLATERLRHEITLACRNGCAVAEREMLIEQAIAAAAQATIADDPPPQEEGED